MNQEYYRVLLLNFYLAFVAISPSICPYHTAPVKTLRLILSELRFTALRRKAYIYSLKQ